MTIEPDFQVELAQIEAEAIGWIPLDDGAYLHVGSDETVIQVVGIARKRWLEVMCFGCCKWNRCHLAKRLEILTV